MDRERWTDLCGRLGCPAAAERFDALERAHSESHRHYHTSQHIEECLMLFDELRDQSEFPDEVEYAIWLHDSVYAPRRSDNEEKSAEMAIRWLQEGEIDAESVRRIEELILITRHSAEPATTDEELLVDIDLHILGADPERFNEYEEQVRREYKWVPRVLFSRRRVQILQGFLEREPLYRNAVCQKRFGTEATRNLSRAIAALT